MKQIFKELDSSVHNANASSIVWLRLKLKFKK